MDREKGGEWIRTSSSAALRVLNLAAVSFKCSDAFVPLGIFCVTNTLYALSGFFLGSVAISAVSFSSFSSSRSFLFAAAAFCFSVGTFLLGFATAFFLVLADCVLALRLVVFAGVFARLRVLVVAFPAFGRPRVA